MLFLIRFAQVLKKTLSEKHQYIFKKNKESSKTRVSFFFLTHVFNRTAKKKQPKKFILKGKHSQSSVPNKLTLKVQFFSLKKQNKIHDQKLIFQFARPYKVIKKRRNIFESFQPKRKHMLLGQTRCCRQVTTS